MKNYRETAINYFKSGYNCAQSVLLAFADDLGIDKTTALKIASSFGGGMGRLREVCGAVSGMFIVAGLKKGYISPDARDEKAAHYALIQQMAAEFKKQNSSIVCKELLSGATTDPTPEARTPEYYKKRPCAELVGDAADIAAELFK